ncbi:MAG: amino acid adenylation domain-containing protein, partial [Ginsengibacter sp.]
MKSKQFNKTFGAKTGKGILDLINSKKNNSLEQAEFHQDGESETLYNIWKNLLGHSNFSNKDDFFQVGGNSLKAVQLVSRISKEFSINIELADIFSNTTIAEQSDLIQQKGKSAFYSSSLVATARPENIPLSYSQERLWFIDQMEGSIPYNIGTAFILRGKLNIDALNKSLNQIITRHEILRTTFREENGIPYQYIKEPNLWALQIEERGDDTNNNLQYIQQLISEPFDLAKDYMLRANLLLLNKEEHLLLITMHHIASDGWSMDIIVKEAVSLYKSFSKQLPVNLTPLPLQYADYAIWQRNSSQVKAMETKLNYWKNKLKGVEDLALPLDYPRPAIQSVKGSVKRFNISKELDAGIKLIAQKEGATLFMVLLAAYKILLYRYSGQDNICVGTPVANRGQQEVEGLVGFFVNTLALRSEINGNITFNEFLQEVKITTLEAYSHQEVPFEKVVDVIVKDRNLNRSPIFQAMLVLQNIPDIDKLELEDVQLSEFPTTNNSSKFDITFSINETQNGLEGLVVYKNDLYKAETIEQMVIHFEELLKSITINPTEKLSGFNMLTESQQQQLLIEFNKASVEYPRDKTIIKLFEEQAAINPNGIAVVFEEEHLTFAELNKKSNQLALHLINKGIHKESLVPICIERSIEMIVAVLGILKAGGAYVPISQDYPLDRISYILEDTQSSILISTSSVIDKLPKRTGLEIIFIDEDWAEISNLPEKNYEIDISSSNLAYVIYTSGSTGRPKGVMIEHQALLDHCFGLIESAELKDCRSFALFAPLVFDAGHAIIFSSLLIGASLNVLSKQQIINGETLSIYLKSHPVDCIKIVPSVWLSYANSDNIVLANKVMIFGGEAFSINIIDHLKKLNYKGNVFNHYGPTEATIGKCIHKLDLQKSYSTVPIGKPFSNTKLYVMSQSDQLVPLGIAGELYIAGEGLARGYLNLPGLTAEKFIGDPFNPDTAARIYKTGDKVKWNNEGEIEYLGRIDEQVKIRGHRIELGEIENALLQSGKVNHAAVHTIDDSKQEKILVGYIVSEGQLNKDELMSHLRMKLPDYMVPSIWIKMERLPLTSNGKINKKALPVPDLSDLSGKEYQAPRNEIEVKLAQIWQELLDAEKVSIHDNFFHIGGHSLLAMRLVSSIRTRLGIEMQVKTLFIYPTIAQLSQQLKETARSLPQAMEVKVKPENIPVSFSQERLWLIDQLEGSNQYHVATVLRLKGKLDVNALNKSFAEIVNRHEVLRSVFYQGEDGKVYQRIKEKEQWQMDISNEIIHGNDAAELTRHIGHLIERPFDLSRDYMLRVTLLNTGEDHLLVVTIHHIASDGWSVSLIVKELLLLYKNYSEGFADNLAQLGLQYSDYAIWQRDYLQGELLENKMKYWKEKMEGIKPLELPIDYPRPALQNTHGSELKFNISKELEHDLNLVCKAENVTLFMVLLAAYKVLLYNYSGQDDICVGTPVANRGQKEIEELIGFFVNTLALRSTVNGSISFTDFLQNIKNTTIEAYEHQDVPFEKLVAGLKERDLSRSPLFQVMLVLQNTPDVPKLKLGQLQISDEAIPLNTSKFELTFLIKETDTGLQGSVEYNTDLYKEETVQRMALHFVQLLKSITKSPSKQISQLKMLSSSEEDQILNKFNNTAVEYPQTKTIIDLFEEQAKKAPENVALVFEGKQVSYGELNERSNQLARYLKKKGVKEEALVPLCIERSIEMIVGILGILKAGGAYVPIDPEYPSDRIIYMLEDTKATIIISSKASSNKLPELTGVQIIEVDAIGNQIESESITELEHHVTANSLAYIIYTSGSTGKPKGVMVEHKNVVSLVMNSGFVDLRADDKLLSTGSSSFDATTFEYWGMLLNGGQLFLCDEASLLNSELLKNEIAVNNITKMWFTSSWFNQLVEIDMSIFNGLQTILVGGEKLSKSHIEKIKNYHPSLQVINGYGPTENTTFSLTYKIIEAKNTASIPIGKPLNNRTAYILRNGLQLTPVGVRGEIYLGGAGLSRGYLNKPELTSERFINNPFSQSSSEKLYKTGDLGRWLGDGNIEYLGRIDDQVKIRGYRIELGEIENVIQQSGLIKESVVVVLANSEGINRLVGYVTSKDKFDKKGLITYLNSKLPAYMIPLIWVELDQLPLTANGKIDKKALPDPDFNQLTEDEYLAPRNKVELELTGIWQELLGIQNIGINDNFFELGGDSILTIQAVSRSKRLGYELKPKDIFLHQTIAKLSAAIDQSSKPLVIGEQGILEGAAGLTPIQDWFFNAEPEATSHFNQSVLLKIDKTITEEVLNTAVEFLCNHHDSLRFKYSKIRNNWHQEYIKSSTKVNVEIIKSGSNGQQPFLIQELCNKYQRRLSIENGHIIQVVLIQTTDDKYNRIFIVAHHLVIDGVSWRILVEDLELLLSNIISAKEITLGNKSSSFRQWYNALEKYSHSDELLSQKKYWQKCVATSSLPTDKNYTGIVKVKDIAHVVRKLSAIQTKRLIHDVSRTYHTDINDILLSALTKTLYDWSKNQQIIIGLEGHGREEISEELDVSRTIGWFTSLYPVLININELESEHFGDLIKTVKEQLRQVPAKGIGYGILKYINKEKNLQDNKPWEIIFNYLGQVDNVVRESKWFSVATEMTGDSHSPEMKFSNKLSVNSIITDGELCLNWAYSAKHYEKETAEALASNYVSNLELIIAHCLEQQQKGEVYTPSDYGLGSEITYNELDEFLDEKLSSGTIRDQIDGLYPLSGLQQGMLFHNLYDGEAAAYTIQLSCFFTKLNLSFFRQSWNEVLKSHTILRSAFYYNKFNVPIQCVFKKVELPLTEVDYRSMSSFEQTDAIKKYTALEREKGFDFTSVPLMRIVLIQLSEERYFMLWTYHHIILDGWSLPILMEEFLSNYKALINGEKPKMRSEDRFENYIRYIEKKSIKDQKAHWQNYLTGVESPALLPFIENSIERNKGAGEYKSAFLEMDALTAIDIKNYAQSLRITPNTLIQGVWSYLLYSYTGLNNIVFGVTVSGRPDDLPGVEDGVGLYINPLPLHAKIAKGQRIDEWLKILQDEQVFSRQFQNTPLSKIQEWCGLEGDLFDCLLTFENYPFSKLIASTDWGLQVEDVRTYDKNNYPLTILVALGEKLNVRFSYNSTLLGQQYIDMIINHFENVLLQFIKSPDQKIEDIKLLTESEKAGLRENSTRSI